MYRRYTHTYTHLRTKNFNLTVPPFMLSHRISFHRISFHLISCHIIDSMEAILSPETWLSGEANAYLKTDEAKAFKKVSALRSIFLESTLITFVAYMYLIKKLMLKGLEVNTN